MNLRVTRNKWCFQLWTKSGPPQQAPALAWAVTSHTTLQHK